MILKEREDLSNDLHGTLGDSDPMSCIVKFSFRRIFSKCSERYPTIIGFNLPYVSLELGFCPSESRQ